MSLKISLLLSVFLLGAGIAILFAVEHKEHILESEKMAVIPKNTLTLFVDGAYEDYLEFIRDQPKEKQLKWKQFQEIHELSKVVKNEIGDQKIPEIVSILEMDLEESFAKLKNSRILEENESVFEAAFFLYIIDSLENALTVSTREVYVDLLRVKKAIYLLKKEGVKEAFDSYKTKLANLLELDRGSILHQYLLKEALKKRIYTISEIQKMKEELLALPSDQLYKLIHVEYEVESHP